MHPAPPRRSRPPEVLAPAGGHPQLRAAIEAGADAVYFGLTDFSARARAANFTPEELPEVMAQLHERGVMGFVTINTLIYDEELPAVARALEHAARHGADAIIVQDLGVAALAQRITPDLPLHGSTQMTVTSAESAQLVARLGLERVVLGRELSVREIREVLAGTELEVEVFVHGALCVSYSGQCFSSEAWGGRSANRGQCAQACRLPYTMVVDGRERDLGDVSYLLSPQDLAGMQHIPALTEAGVSCFKIEGRLKGPEYVAATTAAYRAAVDAAWAERPLPEDPERDLALAQVYSRGLTPGFLQGPMHQRLVQGRTPRHRGIAVGKVLAVRERTVQVALHGPLKSGDGVVFDGARAQDQAAGGSVHLLLRGGQRVEGEPEPGIYELLFGPEFRLDRVAVGDGLWRTRDPALSRRLQQVWEGGVQRRVPVSGRVEGRPGLPLVLSFSDPQGREISGCSNQPLQEATGRALDAERLRDQLGRLGDTPFVLDQLEVALDGACFLPVSQLNALRREVAGSLRALRAGLRVRDTEAPSPVEPRRVGLTASPRPVAVPLLASPRITLLCRSPEQVQAALVLPEVHAVAVDFLEVKGLGAAIAQVQAAGKEAIAVSPRVLKPSEERIRAFLLKLGADAILVRSLGLLESLLQAESAPPLYGDFSLNCTNAATRDLLLDAGLARLAPGHDLNGEQLAALATPQTAGRLELIAHHHLPIFHTEHCVFARFLSDGNSRKDCGAPCERHELHLRGRDGKEHLVRADMGCRNTVFNADAQSGLRGLHRYVEAGYRHIRIELADHGAAEVAPLVAVYAQALRGELDGGAAWRALRDGSRFGLTTGSLAVVQEPGQTKTPGWMARHQDV